MAKHNVWLPFGYFFDPNTGQPLASGSVYVGSVGLDPEVEVNRITVTLLQENGTEVNIPPAAQPLTISAGGVIVYNGSPVRVTAASDYSIKVLNSVSTQIYYVPNSAEDPLAVTTLPASQITVDDTGWPFIADFAQDAFDEIIDYLYNQIHPPGSYYIGPNPNGVFPGTWVQLAEGTFLMNTISGSDPSGGTTFKTMGIANMPPHSHGGVTGGHLHHIFSSNPSTTNNPVLPTSDVSAGSSTGSNNDYTMRIPNVPQTASLGETDIVQDTIATEGSGVSFDTRPPYKGVAIWERTA